MITIIKALLSKFLGQNTIQKRAIVRGFGLSYVEMAVLLFFSFYLTPFILKSIGPSAYGLWAALGSIIGYFGLFDLGMGASTVKFTAEYCAHNRGGDLNKLLNTSIVIYLILGLIITVISLIIAPLIPHIFHLQSDLSKAGIISFFIMSLSVIQSLITNIFQNFIFGHQRVDVMKTFSIVQIISNAMVTILFLHLGFGLIGVVCASLCTGFLILILDLIFIYRNNYGFSFSIKFFDLKTLQRIMPYSIRCFILSLTAQIIYRTSNIIIALILGIAMVPPYAILSRLTTIAANFCLKIQDGLFPSFSRLGAMNDYSSLRSLVIKNLNVTLGITVPISIFLFFFGRSFIVLWVGEKNFAGIGVLIILVAMNFLHSLSPMYTILQALEKNKEVMYSSIIDAALNLFLSIILIQKLGFLGVALATIIAHVCTDDWVVIWAFCKYTNVSFKSILFTGILPPLIAGIPVGIITYLFLRIMLSNNSYIHLGIKGILICILYILAYFCIWILPKKKFRVVVKNHLQKRALFNSE